MALFVIMCCCADPGARVEAQDASAVAEARSGVVRVLEYATKEDGTMGLYTGSAFCIHIDEEGRCVFLSNTHVVWDEYQDMLAEIYIPLASPEEGGYLTDDLVACDVLYYEENADPDIAVIRTQEPVEGIRILPLLSSSEMEAGDTVYALGYPGAVDDAITAEAEDVTVTKGTLSRFTVLESHPKGKLMQHDAVISGGNSGGVLLTEDGAVIGINTYGIGDNYSYAIIIDQAMEVLDSLGIPYTLYETKDSFLGPVGIGIIGVLILGAAWILIRRKKKSASGKGVVFTLVAESGTLEGQSWMIQGQPLLMGREEVCEVKFPPEEKGISRRHASLTVNGAAVTLLDLDSSCGTFVKGERLQPQIPVTMVRGEKFWIGSRENTFVIR